MTHNVSISPLRGMLYLQNGAFVSVMSTNAQYNIQCWVTAPMVGLALMFVYHFIFKHSKNTFQSFKKSYKNPRGSTDIQKTYFKVSKKSEIKLLEGANVVYYKHANCNVNYFVF
jgi:hypothetical protein